MLDIREVYDPKSDGINYEMYCKARAAVSQFSQALANAVGDGLTRRVENSEIEVPESETTTLKEYLYEHYFPTIRRSYLLVFMDGKCVKELTSEEAKSFDAEALAREKNSIPFMFFRNIETD